MRKVGNGIKYIL